MPELTRNHSDAEKAAYEMHMPKKISSLKQPLYLRRANKGALRETESVIKKKKNKKTKEDYSVKVIIKSLKKNLENLKDPSFNKNVTTSIKSIMGNTEKMLQKSFKKLTAGKKTRKNLKYKKN